MLVNATGKGVRIVCCSRKRTDIWERRNEQKEQTREENRESGYQRKEAETRSYVLFVAPSLRCLRIKFQITLLTAAQDSLPVQ